MTARGPLGDRVAAALAALDFAGVVLACGPDGVLAEVAAGLADRANGRPNRVSTRFGIASVGKAFTAVAMVRLWERGIAAPDTRVVDVLGPDRRPRTLDPGVTLAHLVSHSSGIADYFDEYGEAGYDTLWLRTSPAAMRAPADLLPLFADRPPLDPPGARGRYSNAGFVLAGIALEALTGRAFFDVVADEVFGPAGMTATGYPSLDDVVPDLALGHLPPESPGEPWRTNLYGIPARGQPDGGAYTTAGDLVAFLDAIRDGRLLGEPWRDELLRPHAWDPEEEAHYALGFWAVGEGDRARYAIPGEDPGFAARLAWYHRAGVRVAVLSNVTGGAGRAFRALEEVLVPAG